ncbi:MULTISPECIES: amidase [unclassified Bradyrhizobium]|uniref:amidase n=1 Tax=unclassified Bradyrhizobium TaxID=2631580 RepID=UPI00211E6504|nr:MULTISPECIES: amidase [unclassified Bradyrhizobium]MDD1534710.1 Asp-tRNA(Asn)/Glu-tRNA(Gln) amidotransferase GatCAB subunit A [Bradyrhizobium sp. WBOS8]MDD1584201.1 Asp-tRNA(Asn)/Glu-tRNA(Gln) amidotransferase GatCAB subunit A [Bradyrhizobium sp. WBOS4]UUO50542.1 Asp-tRNA(Asn)/Glu-tRNA(Gln) amidotransferase GatCAB subunit A [Bradyrhizobium sp. WBOS04]UUO57920.1 Asp-tRNA(Asn)/Glu-tRNA(Gln) amidotransferase GatCAB subunit A [Bradyrhizobium sp. WBOS08]
MAATDLHYLGLVEIGQKLQAKELSSVEVTKALLGRIDELDGKLKSFAHVMADSALAEAAAAEKEIASGKIKGPLHGVPVAVKDLCWAKGAPSAHGMTIHRDFRPTEDATVVARLKDAGAIILGKLQQTEGAYADHHPKIDPPRNPWNADLWPGASSSGSGVATAAGLCFGSLGTDTGGSIRFPSAANGVTGLKPTWGRVSRYGAFELAATLDHIGPMARSAVDCGAILGVIAGKDPKDTTAVPLAVPDYLAGLTGDLRDVTIGIDRRWTSEGTDGDAAKVLAEGLRVAADLGAKIKEIAFPDPKAIIDDWFPLCGIEVAVAHEDTYPARKDQYGPALAGLLDLGRQQSGMDYQKIVLRREAFRGAVRALFETVDLLAIPAQAFAAPTLAKMAALGEDASLIGGLLRFTCPFDMTGSPTVTLPGGFAANGGPVGFQFVGRHFDEALLVRAGDAFQRVTDWHKRHPAI